MTHIRGLWKLKGWKVLRHDTILCRKTFASYSFLKRLTSHFRVKYFIWARLRTLPLHASPFHDRQRLLPPFQLRLFSLTASISPDSARYYQYSSCQSAVWERDKQILAALAISRSDPGWAGHQEVVKDGRWRGQARDAAANKDQKENWLHVIVERQ